METGELNELDYTENAWEAMYDAVDSTYFLEQDADLIYRTLQGRLNVPSFGDYLKRYIYRKAEIEEPFESVSLKTYQDIIRVSFDENQTAPSFTPTTAKISNLAKNWLTQRSVRREVVFLLGFGLAMSPDDVNQFLNKALREQKINAKDPFEVTCWYCYRRGYNFLMFEDLWKTYQTTPVSSLYARTLYSEETISVQNTMYSIRDEADLFTFLSQLKTDDNQTKTSRTARRHFDALYNEARDQIAKMQNQMEEERFSRDFEEYLRKLNANERLYDYEKRRLLQKKRAERKVYDRTDITEADLERVISSAIPLDRHGNLTSGKASALNEQFDGKRFSRQHIHDILSGRSQVNRFDLITLNFFVFSQKTEEYANAKQRYDSFIESTNRILDACFLGPLYIANPYECFVLMCILSDDPLGTYADVWELSYETQAE